MLEKSVTDLPVLDDSVTDLYMLEELAKEYVSTRICNLEYRFILLSAEDFLNSATFARKV